MSDPSENNARTSSRDELHRFRSRIPDQRSAIPKSQRRMGRDRSLQARMLMTIFLLGAVYSGVIGGLVFSGAATVVIAAAVGLVVAVQFLVADRLALAGIAAKAVSPAQQPHLHAVIERLCIEADIPKPRLALVDTRMPNAFAVGRSRKAATVCVTTGLLALLTPAELEAVLAHELAHVINRDMMVMTVAGFLGAVAALFARLTLRFGMRGHPINQLAAVAFAVLCSITVYLVSFVLLRTLSRHREYAADRGAAMLTGHPSALASALLKITDTMSLIPRRDLRAAGQLNAFFIASAGPTRTIIQLFASHPPVEKRIAALSQLETRLHNSQ